MSRIGNKPVSIPEGVTIDVSASNVITAKGPKGELSQAIDKKLTVKLEEGELIISRTSEMKDDKAKHGLYRTLVGNIVQGVSTGYEKKLEFVGVGYKAACQNNVLELNVGYSHSIFFALPAEVKGDAVTEKGKNPIVTLESIDKQLLGQVAAKIKSLRKIEPYKGKGIKFVGEYVRRKAGKTAAK